MEEMTRKGNYEVNVHVFLKRFVTYLGLYRINYRFYICRYILYVIL